jgi:hypothetical protein
LAQRNKKPPKVEPFDWSKWKVYVHGPGKFEYMRMFAERGLIGADLDEADIVCWTGGADVDPSLYNEKNATYHGRPMSGFDTARDDIDLRVFGYAADKYKVGICRGGQLLNVCNGGKMWQHVDKHAGAPHDLIDTTMGQVVRVTSTHHQMMRPAPEGIVLAYAREAHIKIADGDEWDIKKDHVERPEELNDVEVVWYEESKSLCFQPHPEHRNQPQCTDYFFSLMERMVAG